MVKLGFGASPWLVVDAVAVVDSRAGDRPTPERAAAELAYQTGMLRILLRHSPVRSEST